MHFTNLSKTPRAGSEHLRPKWKDERYPGHQWYVPGGFGKVVGDKYILVPPKRWPARGGKPLVARGTLVADSVISSGSGESSPNLEIWIETVREWGAHERPTIQTVGGTRRLIWPATPDLVRLAWPDVERPAPQLHDVVMELWEQEAAADIAPLNAILLECGIPTLQPVEFDPNCTAPMYDIGAAHDQAFLERLVKYLPPSVALMMAQQMGWRATLVTAIADIPRAHCIPHPATLESADADSFEALNFPGWKTFRGRFGVLYVPNDSIFAISFFTYPQVPGALHRGYWFRVWGPGDEEILVAGYVDCDGGHLLGAEVAPIWGDDAVRAIEAQPRRRDVLENPSAWRQALEILQRAFR